MKKLAQKIIAAKTIVLSTHRQCDGDGLGAEVALYHALKKSGKKVRLLNVDSTPKKYFFLLGVEKIEFFESSHTPLEPTDLSIVFDTNDPRLLGDLFKVLKKNCKDVVFVDHHPALLRGPPPTKGSYIDINAASTGEITFQLIKEMGIALDEKIARALYMSIAFDTNLFRFIRNSPKSHLIAAELMDYNVNVEDIHRHIFGNQTIKKMAFLAKALGDIEYYCDEKVAFLKVKDEDLISHGIDMDETRDIIDMIMNISSVEAAILFREDGENDFKISLRSKGKFEVLDIAESLGGGGHIFSAGAFLQGSYEKLKEQTLKLVTKQFQVAS